MKLEDLDDLFLMLSKFTGYTDIVVGLITGGVALYEKLREAFQASTDGALTPDEIRVFVQEYFERQDILDEGFREDD